MSEKSYEIAFKLTATLHNESSKKAENIALRVAERLNSVGGASTQAARDWESAWAGVHKVTGATEEDLQALEDTARRMAMELPHTHNAIASVFEAGSRLGIATDHLEGFSRTMLEVESATTLTLDKAAIGFADIANVMGTSHGDFDRMGSTVLKLGNNFNTTEADILKMSSRMAGSAAAIRMTESQLMGLAAATSAVGIEATVGAAAWNQVMSDMDIAIATGNDSLAKFAQIAGKTTDDFATAFREDAMGAITTFIGGLNQIDNEGGSVASTLYTMGYSADDARQTLMNLAGGYDTLIGALEMSNVAWAENTELTKVAGERYATMEARMQVMKNRMQDVGITIGQVLVPPVKELVGEVGNLIGKTTAKIGSALKAYEKMEKTIKTIGKAQKAYGKFRDTLEAVKTVEDAKNAVTTANAKLTKINTAVTETAKRASAARRAATLAENKALKLAVQAEIIRATSGAKSAKAIAATAAAEKARTAATKAGKIANKQAIALDKIRKNQAVVNTAALKADTAAQTANKLATTKLGKAIASVKAFTASLKGKTLSANIAAIAQKALGMSTKGLSIAFAKMSKAITAIPVFGWILAGVTLVIAAVAGLVIWLNRTGEEYKAIGEEAERLRERQQQLTNSAQNSAEEFARNSRIMREYGSRIESVADRAEHLAQMQSDNLSEKNRLTMEAIALDLELQDVYAKRNDLEEQLNSGLVRGRGNRRAVEQAINNLIAAEEGYKAALEANANQMEFVNGLYNDNVRALEEISRAQQQAAIETYGYERAMMRQAFTAQEWEQATSEALSKMSRAFEGHMKVASNVFDTIDQRGVTSLDDMVANLTANADAVERASENLAILQTMDFDGMKLDPAFIEQLRGLGAAGADQIAKLVYEFEKAPERIAEINNSFDRSALAATEAAARDFDPDGLAKSAEELMDTIAYSILTNTSMEEALTDKINVSLTTFSEAIEIAGFDDEGYNIAIGTAVGIENGSIHVERVMRAMVNRAIEAAKQEAEINSPSKKTMELGEYFVDGMTIGIYSKAEELVKACEYISGLVTDSLYFEYPEVPDPDYASIKQQIGYQNALYSQLEFDRFSNLNFDEFGNPFQATRPIDSINRLDNANIWGDTGGDFHYHGSPITIDGSGLGAVELEEILERRLSEERAQMQRYHKDQQAREMRLANV